MDVFTVWATREAHYLQICSDVLNTIILSLPKKVRKLRKKDQQLPKLNTYIISKDTGLIVCAASYHTAAAAKSLQSCSNLCDPIDGSPPGSPIPGILQARTLEWVAISFSNAWKWRVKVKSLSRVLLFATPWTAAYQAPPSMGFSRQEYWSWLPLPSLHYAMIKTNKIK